MSNRSRLIPISYYNASQEVRLSAYADTIIFEQEPKQKTLRAIRFGGYPEMVRALADAVYAGANLEAVVNDQPLHLVSVSKRYRRQVTHDGVYAEATLLAMDDDQDNTKAEDELEDQTSMELPPRKSILFCPLGDKDALFDQLDRKTAVPLIPAFRDYVLEELQRRGILKPLTVLSLREKLEAWVLESTMDDSNIVSVVEDGLQQGAIAIPDQVKDPNGFTGVENVTGYLNTFGVVVAQRIRKQFQPLFDPSAEPLSPEILSINDYVREKAGYSLYDAQLAVAESIKQDQEQSKFSFLVAECGSGKTKIGATAMAAAQTAKEKTFNIVLCPSHVQGKWVREIAETLPNTVGVQIKSNLELEQLYRHYQQGSQSVYAVLSKEKARDGYMKRPAALWNKHRGQFLCPDCLQPIMKPFTDDGVRYVGAVNQFFFRVENARNRYCDHCGSVLWTAVAPSRQSEWVKISNYGWVHRRLAWEHMGKTKNSAVRAALQEIIDQPDGSFPTAGAFRRYPMSSYIKRKFKGRLDGCIVDELHEYNNDSGQGDAMAEITSVAKHVIGMTATLINGYSSGIFHLLYRTMPGQMMQDGKPHDSPNLFDAEYGVVENTYEETSEEYAANRRTHRTKTKTRQLPGVSPLVYSRFLLEHTAFLSLSDMGKDLPDYEEIPVPLDMEADVEVEYKRVENELKKVLKTDAKAAKRILSAYLNLLTIYPDQPYDQPPILHPLDGIPLVEPASVGDFDTIGAKEQAVLEIVQRKIANGERVLVYTSWTRSDSQRKLHKLLTEAGFRTEIMTGSVQTSKREALVQNRLASGLQVLITNPSLVETGLDLNAFTTIVFYSMGYKLFTLRQASRRSWRINQTAPRVEVYLLYYKNTMQHKAMKLMASKLAVAGIIEGNFTEEGLAAMSDVQDMTSVMAKELMQGIRDNVEDIAAAFKRMAILNPNRQPPPDPVPTPTPLAALPLPAVTPAERKADPEREARIAALLAQATPKKRTRKVIVDENQMTLFGDVA